MHRMRIGVMYVSFSYAFVSHEMEVIVVRIRILSTEQGLHVRAMASVCESRPNLKLYASSQIYYLLSICIGMSIVQRSFYLRVISFFLRLLITGSHPPCIVKLLYLGLNSSSSILVRTLKL